MGNLFVGRKGANVARLEPMPAKPTFVDFFRLRFQDVSNHVLQSANHAMQTGMEEEVIFACLLHDTVHSLIKVDHGWWGAQMYAPYVSEKVDFAIRYHQALRFYDDPAHGYKYPDLYRRLFGEDYKPEPYIDATYKMVRAHKWYEYPRLVTVNDLYAFEPGVNPKLEQFTDIVGRHFKQPKEGLGYDNSPIRPYVALHGDAGSSALARIGGPVFVTVNSPTQPAGDRWISRLVGAGCETSGHAGSVAKSVFPTSCAKNNP